MLHVDGCDLSVFRFGITDISLTIFWLFYGSCIAKEGPINWTDSTQFDQTLHTYCIYMMMMVITIIIIINRMGFMEEFAVQPL